MVLSGEIRFHDDPPWLRPLVMFMVFGDRPSMNEFVRCELVGGDPKTYRVEILDSIPEPEAQILRDLGVPHEVPMSL